MEHVRIWATVPRSFLTVIGRYLTVLQSTAAMPWRPLVLLAVWAKSTKQCTEV